MLRHRLHVTKNAYVAIVPQWDGIVAGLVFWARTLKRDLGALNVACRDPRVPWPAKAVALCVVVYFLSPIDFIPDFIPVLGYLDDLIILPLGIALAIRLVPSPLMAEFRAQVVAVAPTSFAIAGAIAVALVWLILAASLLFLIRRILQ
jgi:uncharacterized membrane protein YkvA (DUF1232 family)